MPHLAITPAKADNPEAGGLSNPFHSIGMSSQPSGMISTREERRLLGWTMWQAGNRWSFCEAGVCGAARPPTKNKGRVFASEA